MRSAAHGRDGAPTPSDGDWVFCALPGQMCVFTGTREVRYGAVDRYRIKTFTDGVLCHVKNFGDPYPGVAKHCDIH